MKNKQCAKNKKPWRIKEMKAKREEQGEKRRIKIGNEKDRWGMNNWNKERQNR